MKLAGISRIILEEKEGLALNNGATFSAAIASVSMRKATPWIPTGAVTSRA